MDHAAQLPPQPPNRARRHQGDGDVWRSLFSGFARNDISLQAGIRQTVVAAIEAQRLPQNTQMPSGRQLAKVLGIARNTVVLAYQQLIDEGFLESRERSGYFVAAHAMPRATPSVWACHQSPTTVSSGASRRSPNA
jgi:GntR family transcriptional regulator / MocR family aminotransferase